MLGKYFSIKEFEHSNTAISRGISNKMNAEQILNAKALVKNVLDPLREWLGKPLRMNSGFRSSALNTAIKGAKSSQHMKGEASDIPIDAKAFDFIRQNLEFDQLIWEFGNDSQPQWVHVSFSLKRNRKQVLKAKKVNGKTVYLPM